jgi:hypothetical protein
MYKIYSVQITQFGEPGTVVISAYKNAGGYFKAESFCTLPEPHIEKVFMGLRFDEKSFDDSPVELNEDFMLEEALAQSRIDIELHIVEHYANKNFVIPLGDLKLQETGISFLAHLHVRNKADFLKDIYRVTGSEDLRAAIKPILELPQILRTNLAKNL